ncbi:hypothetical protein [uncultured Algibacter sp.]|uniref:hypothetical protein n=1 Tax=uncultured Algibacter sp. TaxID=298659 RepID=UPI00260C19A7|nr:hypothetical protein [uncultured Algibacter sp.]
MKEQEDNYLDNFAKKIIRNSVVETPSFNFTEDVMSRVSELSKSSVIAYEPLISKKSWIVIGVSLMVLVLYLLFGNQLETSNWFGMLDFSVISNNAINNVFSGITISKTFGYAIIFFCLMFCIQIPFLKHHFNQRLES